MKKTIQKIVMGMIFAIICLITVHTSAQAMTTEDQPDGKTIYRIQSDDYAQTTMTVGKQGVFTYDLSGVTDPMDGSAITTLQVTTLSSSDSSVLEVNSDGSFTALAPGEATVYIQGTYGTYNMYFSGRCDVTVSIDMTNIELDKTSIKGIYSTYAYQYEESIALKNVPEGINLTEDNTTFSCESGNSDFNAYCSLEENQLKFTFYSAGKTTLTVTINGKIFQINVNIQNITISKQGVVEAKGKKVKLKIKGTSDKPVWSSSNPKVAKVSKKGVVSCKKIGNAVITANFDGSKVGCAISVVSAKKVKVIKYAKMIGTKWKYSQPKRMQKGYYDCSSLVWKSYCKMGKKIGGNYAPVAADLAKWCKAHGKKITKSYTRNHIQKMKLNPGDLMFETGANNGRYLGIYHVEMFTGYTLAYYDGEGKPVLYETWGARPDGYYGGGYMIYRPYK
ncbi:MAG: Ig-like domain-containing protein [Eubacterium sp.]